MAKTLPEVLTESGIELHESSSGRLIAKCPFHKDDNEPSFTVYPNGTYFCFGCEVWGNPVKFLVEFKGMSAKDALESVGEDYTLPKTEKRVIRLTKYNQTVQFLYGVARQYHEYLLANSGPQKYLHGRGLTDETIQKYMLGYTDGGVLDFQFAADYDMGNEVGLISKSGYETMSHRITIPNIIWSSSCDFMIGRTVINDKVKYLGLRMPKPIMGFDEVRHSPVLFMVEGQFDWLLLRQWGYPAVVMSGSHITKANLSLMSGKTIVYIPDQDDTGMKAARSVQSSHKKTVILDISRLGTKDISESANDPDTQVKFAEIVKEQVCDTRLLTPTSEAWLPISKTLILSR